MYSVTVQHLFVQMIVYVEARLMNRQQGAGFLNGTHLRAAGLPWSSTTARVTPRVTLATRANSVTTGDTGNTGHSMTMSLPALPVLPDWSSPADAGEGLTVTCHWVAQKECSGCALPKRGEIG